jgi:hypothetical protein
MTEDVAIRTDLNSAERVHLYSCTQLVMEPSQ